MPIGLQATFTSTVRQPNPWGSVSVSVRSAGPPLATVAVTVFRRIIDAWEQPAGTGTFYFRVRLAGEWIPESDLAGPLTIDRNLDGHTVTFEFGLMGQRWSIFATERTWTRTRVEIHRYRGQSASDVFADAEPLVGYVRTCDQSHEPEPVLQLRCANAAALFERATVCYAIPPFSRKTRGRIISEVLLATGITDFDVPPGAVYDKGLQVVDRPLFDWLREFMEPEGWKIRWRGETLEIYRPEIRRAPLPPDAVWTADRWLASRASPPQDVPSAWILRGNGAVVVDELGLETTITTTEIVAPYAPKRAVARQLSGTSEVVDPLNLGSLAVTNRVISRIVDQRTTRGDQLVGQTTDEHGYYNPGAAKLQSSPSSNGYIFLDAYIDPDGRYVKWISERFHHLSRLLTTPTYDETGKLTQTRVESSGYHLRTKGVGAQGGSTINVIGAYVHGDDQSYSERYERWGKFEEQLVTYDYDEKSGARNQETQDTYRYQAPRCRVSGPAHGGWWNLYNGEAQTELVANWRRVESIVKTQILDKDDATVAGDVETRFGLDGVAQKHDGDFDWGAFRSNVESERFRFLEKKTVRYDVVNDDQVEVETREPGASPRRQTLLGGRPLPAFLESPWTLLRQVPLEIVVDDPTAEAWFGREVRVMQSEHVITTAEGLAVVERARSRALAPEVEVTRPVTYARLGDTVELFDPPSGLAARALVVSIRETWSMATAEFLAVYVLEVDR